MRAERFELIRRKLDEELAALTALGRAKEARLDLRRPWDSVFLAAAEDDVWWEAAVREKAILHSTSLKNRAELTDEGHHQQVPASAALPQPGVAASSAPAVPRAPGTGLSATAKRRAAKKAAQAAERQAGQPKQKPPPPPTPRVPRPRGGKKGGGKGVGKPREQQDCWKWCRDASGCTTPCPDGRRHPPCQACSQAHAWMQRCPS